MLRVVATSVILLAAALASASHAQGTGAWNVESEFDLFSYLGLGSIWVSAYQHPDDLPTNDAVLVVGCDEQSPNGFEVSAWVAATPFAVTASADGDVSMLVRFDQGPVATQTWFLTGEIGVQETVARRGGLPTIAFTTETTGFNDAFGALGCR